MHLITTTETCVNLHGNFNWQPKSTTFPFFRVIIFSRLLFLYSEGVFLRTCMEISWKLSDQVQRTNEMFFFCCLLFHVLCICNADIDWIEFIGCALGKLAATNNNRICSRLYVRGTLPKSETIFFCCCMCFIIIAMHSAIRVYTSMVLLMLMLLLLPPYHCRCRWIISSIILILQYK